MVHIPHEFAAAHFLFSSEENARKAVESFEKFVSEGLTAEQKKKIKKMKKKERDSHRDNEKKRKLLKDLKVSLLADGRRSRLIIRNLSFKVRFLFYSSIRFHDITAHALFLC